VYLPSDDQGSGVVAGLGLPGRSDHCLGVGFRRGTTGEQIGQFGLRHDTVHAVCGQQQPVMRLQGDRTGVQPEIRLDADRAIEDVAETGLGQHVILRQPGQHTVTEVPGPAVAYVQHRRLSAAHDQGGEGRGGTRHVRIRSPLCMEPAIVARQRRHTGRRHTLQRVLIDIGVDEGPPGQFGRDPASPRSTDAVSDQGDHAVQRLFRRAADVDGPEVLIVRARPLRRGEPRRDLKPCVRAHHRSPCR
jgi:hypothetical protein